MKGVKDTSGKRSQAKGRAGELELCRLLQEYGYPVQPGEAVSYGSTPESVSAEKGRRSMSGFSRRREIAKNSKMVYRLSFGEKTVQSGLFA